MKFRVKLGLQKKNDAEKIDLGESTHDKILADPVTFTNVNPALLTYKNAYLAYRTAYENALLGGKPLKQVLRTKRDEFIVLLKQMAYYVNNVANGDGVIITAAGFDTNSPPNSHLMPQVTGVTLSSGAHTGEIDASWDKVEGVAMFLVYARPQGSANPYALVVKTTRSHAVAGGLTAGQLYDVVVEACGHGTNNVGPLSDPVQVRAAF
jgi:hypothetical protein